jgi:hypothetical protein
MAESATIRRPMVVTTAPFDLDSWVGRFWETLPGELNRLPAVRKVDFGEKANLENIRTTGQTEHGAGVFAALWFGFKALGENSFLARLYKEEGVERMRFGGDHFIAPDGTKRVFCVWREQHDGWHWNCCVDYGD